MKNFTMSNQEETLIKIVTTACNLTIEEIRSSSRSSSLVIARGILGCMLKSETGCTYKRAGELVGRDHSSVISYERKFKDNIRFYKKYRDIYNAVSEEYSSHYSDVSLDIMSKQILQIEQQLEVLKKRQLSLMKN